MAVFITSPDGRYDQTYLANFVALHIKDELAKLDGVGDVQQFGGGNYSMRIWLDPDKVAARGLTASDVANAIREQNVQVAAGQLGSPATPANTPESGRPNFQVAINTKGRLVDEEDFRNIIIRAGSEGQITRLRDVARVELGSDNYALRSMLNNETAVAIPIFVAFARMYRGMHHPLDVVGGVLVGAAALVALVAESAMARGSRAAAA